MAYGPYAVTNYVMEARRAQMQGLRNAKQVTLDVAKEFAEISGRQYGLFEEYRLEDADYAMVIIGSAAGTAKDTVDLLREKGIKQESSKFACSVLSRQKKLPRYLAM